MSDSSVKVLESAADAFIAAGVHLAQLHLLHGWYIIIWEQFSQGLQNHILPKA